MDDTCISRGMEFVKPFENGLNMRLQAIIFQPKIAKLWRCAVQRDHAWKLNNEWAAFTATQTHKHMHILIYMRLGRQN